MVVTEEEVGAKWHNKVEPIIQAQMDIIKRTEQKEKDEGECIELQRQREPFVIVIQNKTATEEQQAQDCEIREKLSVVRKRLSLFNCEITKLDEKFKRLKETLAR